MTKKFRVGDSVTVVRTVTEDDLTEFGRLTGDTNPIHFSNHTNKAIVHGAFLNSIVSGVIGTELPGPGTLVVSQNLYFPHKCFVHDVITVKVELVEMRKIIKVRFTCEVEQETLRRTVMNGDAKLVFKQL